MFTRIRKFIVALLFVGVLSLLTACATTQQGGVVETYDRLTYLYDSVARTLARTCVYHNVPKEKCDQWGREVNAARALLLEMGDILDRIIAVYVDPTTDPECKKLVATCNPDNVSCLEQARQMCLDKYYGRYYALQRKVAELLRRLQKDLIH